MRKLALIFALVSCAFSSPQSVTGNAKTAGNTKLGSGRVVTVGNQTFDGSYTGSGTFTVWTPFQTPAGSAGYTVRSAHVNVANVGGLAGMQIIAGVYTNQTNPSVCPVSRSDCANAKLCESELLQASAGDNELHPSGCGTLASSTLYWLAVRGDNINSYYEVLQANFPSQWCPGTGGTNLDSQYTGSSIPVHTLPDPAPDPVTLFGAMGRCITESAVLNCVGTC